LFYLLTEEVAGCSENACSEHGECSDSGVCICNVGFSGEDCSIESYKNYNLLQLNGDGHVEAIPFAVGGLWEDSPSLASTTTIKILVIMYIQSSSSSQLVHLSDEDQEHLFELGIQNDTLYLRTRCYFEEFGTLWANMSVPSDEWVSVTAVIEGILHDTCANSTQWSKASLYMNGQLIGQKHGMAFPHGSIRSVVTVLNT
jgi:hypothetical protein